MLIIKRGDDESIDRLVRRYKRKHRKVNLRKELNRRKVYTKPSVKRRKEILHAKYRLQKYGIE